MDRRHRDGGLGTPLARCSLHFRNVVGVLVERRRVGCKRVNDLARTKGSAKLKKAALLFPLLSFKAHSFPRLHLIVRDLSSVEFREEHLHILSKNWKRGKVMRYHRCDK